MEYETKNLVVDGAMTGVAVINSLPIDLSSKSKFSFQVSYVRSAAILAGSYKVQISNEPGDVANWVDLAGATGTVTDTATGSEIKSFVDVAYRSARVVYTNSTGTGVLQIKAISKE